MAMVKVGANYKGKKYFILFYVECEADLRA